MISRTGRQHNFTRVGAISRRSCRSPRLCHPASRFTAVRHGVGPHDVRRDAVRVATGDSDVRQVGRERCRVPEAELDEPDEAADLRLFLTRVAKRRLLTPRRMRTTGCHASPSRPGPASVSTIRPRFWQHAAMLTGRLPNRGGGGGTVMPDDSMAMSVTGSGCRSARRRGGEPARSGPPGGSRDRPDRSSRQRASCPSADVDPDRRHPAHLPWTSGARSPRSTSPDGSDHHRRRILIAT